MKQLLGIFGFLFFFAAFLLMLAGIAKSFVSPNPLSFLLWVGAVGFFYGMREAATYAKTN